MIVGIVLFFGLTIFSRMQGEKALKLLSIEEKGMMVGAFSKNRMVSTVLLAVIILAFLFMAYFGHVDKQIALFTYFGAIMLYFIVMAYLGFSKLKTMGLPEEYVQKTLTVTIIRIAGLCIFILLMAIGLSVELMHQH